MIATGPRRIGCLSTEAVDVLYRLGAQDRQRTLAGIHAMIRQLGIGSWCRKRFVPAKVLARPGFAALGATLAEIKSADILSPGPAAIERGLVRLFELIARTSNELTP